LIIFVDNLFHKVVVVKTKKENTSPLFLFVNKKEFFFFLLLNRDRFFVFIKKADARKNTSRRASNVSRVSRLRSVL
jgi:hypothetical protein